MSLLLDALKQAEKNKSQNDLSALQEAKDVHTGENDIPAEEIQSEYENSIDSHTEFIDQSEEGNPTEANQPEQAGMELELVSEFELDVNDVNKIAPTAENLNLLVEPSDLTTEGIESVSKSSHNPNSDPLENIETVQFQKQSEIATEENFDEDALQHGDSGRETAVDLTATTSATKIQIDHADAANILQVSHSPNKKLYYGLTLLFAVLAVIAYLYYLTLPPSLPPPTPIESDIDLLVDSFPENQISEQKETDQKSTTVIRPTTVNNDKSVQAVAKKNNTTTLVKEKSIAEDYAEFVADPEDSPISYPNEIKVKVKQISPKIDVYLNQAYTAYKNQDLAIAENLYKQAAQLDNSNIDALLGLAVIKEHYGDLPRAQVFFEKILSVDANNLYARNALIRLRNGQSPSQQESQLKLVLEKFPDDAQSYFALANLYASKQRWNEAQQAYFKAVDLNPDNADYQYNLAVSLDHLSKKSIALRYYQQAIRLSQNIPPNFNKAAVEYRIQQIQEK